MAWRALAQRPPVPEPVRPPTGVAFGIRVLASGSGGNATLLYVPGKTPAAPARLALIDAGISPTRVRKALAEDGLRLLQLDDIVYTHLDRDHAHPGWQNAPGCRATRRMHRRHVRRAERDGHAYKRCEPYGDTDRLGDRVRLEAVLSAHDQLGVAVLRVHVDTPCGRGAALGFATDVGNLGDGWPDHLRSVDALAIESNYCPVMQRASGRPIFLQHRIMGGAGHLSNEESGRASLHIAPRQRLVLLHLSQQCNRPQLALDAHAPTRRACPGLDVTVSSQDTPTPWLWVAPTAPLLPSLVDPAPRAASIIRHPQPSLFDGDPSSASRHG